MSSWSIFIYLLGFIIQIEIGSRCSSHRTAILLSAILWPIAWAWALVIFLKSAFRRLQK